MSWEENERGEGAQLFNIEGGACRPLPGGRLAYRLASGRRVPAARQGCGRLPQGPKYKFYLHFRPCRPLPVGSPQGPKYKFYLHFRPYRPAGGRQGAGRPAAGR